MLLTGYAAVDKTKRDLIHRAKVKKAYAKIKAQEQKKTQEKGAKPTADAKASDADSEREEAGNELGEPSHDTEEAVPEPPQTNTQQPPEKAGADESRDSPEPDPQMHPARRSNLRKRPGYFDRSLQEAAKRKAEREAREAEFRRRREERERRLRERQRLRRVAAKAREVGPDGRRKLGRESEVLLEKVKKMMGKQ